MAINHSNGNPPQIQPDTPSWSRDRITVRVPKRRDRKTLSCMSCRAKKLRCDRILPECSNCRSRPDVETCVYSTAACHNANSSASTNAPNKNRARGGALSRNLNSIASPVADLGSLQAKLDRLEKTFQGLSSAKATVPELLRTRRMPLTESAVPNGDEPRSTQDKSESSQQMVTSVSLTPSSLSSSSAAGDALWSTLLGELAELHTDIQYHASPPSQRSPSMLLFVASHAVSRADILIHLPSRHTCDKMVAGFFSSLEPTLCFLHQPTFWKQYEEFWQRPGSASIIWVALLFGILRTAISAWMRDNNEPIELQGKCPDLAISFRSRMVECLTHANSARPQEYLIEALLLHEYAEFSASRDFRPDVWVLHGMIVRLSMRLGYHLDPKSLRDVTPFQAEMRRRVWTFVRTSDILLSFQISLPLTIPLRWLGGALPRNLRDDDFCLQSADLPPSLPDTETTPISFLIAKAKLLFCFAKALTEMEQSDGIIYTRVLSLDNEIRSVYRGIPTQYQLHGLPESSVPPSLLFALRIVLASIYHKALCVIHSRVLKAAASDQQYLYSWLCSIDSAMTLLAFQSFQHEHFHVNGRVTALIHYQTSLTIHDFFLAATVLCTTLFLKRGSNIAESSLLSFSGPRREEVLAALERSIDIFESDRGESVEAARACELLRALLQELCQPSRSEQEDIYMSQDGNSSIDLQSTLGNPSASNLYTGIGEPSKTQYSVNSFSQLQSNNQTLPDIIPPYSEWDSPIFGLDLGDPISFVQTLHSQDALSLQ